MPCVNADGLFVIVSMYRLHRWSFWLVFCSIGSGLSFAQSGVVLSSSPDAGVVRSLQAEIRDIKERLDYFQRLLTMEDSDRDRSLSRKTEGQQTFLRGELEKYDAMSIEDRETALQSLRVWYYLRELVKAPADVRQAVLEAVPEIDQTMVRTRLARWDLLPPDLQEQVMTYERTFRYVLQLAELSHEEQKKQAETLPESLKVKNTWEAKLEEWHALPEQRRKEIYSQFQSFFELAPKERAKVLGTLSPQEREQLERSQVLQTFDKLSPEERAACLDSLRKLTEQPPDSEVITNFLAASQRWMNLSAAERDVLKKVIRLLPPMGEPPVPGVTDTAPTGVNRLPAPAPPGSVTPSRAETAPARAGGEN